MQKIKRFLSSITGKKSHVEFITALLSIPVLLTVIALNWSTLNAKKTSDTATKPNEIIISMAPPAKQTIVDTPIPTKAACKPGLGQVTIANPHEGDTISDSPVNITIYYDPSDYCAAVWSYRVNGGTWSDYDNKSIALYDLPAGNIKLDLRVQSVISGGGETTLTRNFTYAPPQTPTATPSQASTPTPTSTPGPTP